MVEVDFTQRNTLHNPQIGHRITFLQTAEETGGRLLQILYEVDGPEAGPVIPEHIHLHTLERFEVLSGLMGVRVDGRQRMLGPGDEVYIPQEMPHTFWNAGEGELRFITDVQPPGALQTYWETVFGLAEDGRVAADGFPNFLQLAVLAPLADSYVTGVPLTVMKGLILVLGVIGRLLGYKARYERYSGG